MREPAGCSCLPEIQQDRCLRHRDLDLFGSDRGYNLSRGSFAELPCNSPTKLGPLIVFQDGTPLSQPLLVTHLQEALTWAGVDTASYSGHSYRIGATSAAAAAGLSDSLIQT